MQGLQLLLITHSSTAVLAGCKHRLPMGHQAASTMALLPPHCAPHSHISQHMRQERQTAMLAASLMRVQAIRVMVL